MKQEVILVTPQDEATGVMEKMEAHRKGLLHRAFSIFIFDTAGRMLLQQRAVQKYHGALLWTNACCSHPYPGEATAAAAARRLTEELGITLPLTEIFAFTYKAAVENDLIEHEYDHVFAGEYEGELNPDPTEVNDYCYHKMDDVRTMITDFPQKFTTWFRLAFPQIEDWWKVRYQQQKLM